MSISDLITVNFAFREFHDPSPFPKPAADSMKFTIFLITTPLVLLLGHVRVARPNKYNNSKNYGEPMSGSNPPSSSRFTPSPLENPPFSTASLSRLQSLYSDISRQKLSNPTSYHTNVEWWRKALEGVVGCGWVDSIDGERARNRLVLSAGRELIDGLRVEGVGKPLGLGAVVVRNLQ